MHAGSLFVEYDVNVKTAAYQLTTRHDSPATSSVSVITVTYNNASGLRQTLSSLDALQFRPLEIVIVDGGSTDATPTVVAEFDALLPLAFESQPDGGIYDAMNRGRSRARGDLVHYLNAGDSVWGEPYRSLNGPSLLTVRIYDEAGHHLFDDFPKLGGYGYCHQGVLFPTAHRPYDTSLRIAADLDLIFDTFPRGLHKLPRTQDGGALFGLGGLSTVAQTQRDREVRKILWSHLPKQRAARFIALLALKNLVPRSLRRQLANKSIP